MQMDAALLERRAALNAPRYVAALLGFTAALLAAGAALTFGTSYLGRPPHEHIFLLTYQAAKLAGPAVRTIFVGDSSLGNAIDVEVWSALSGHQAVNLALTGAFGYEGSYNFIRRSLKNLRPKNVIIMHAPNMMTRPTSDSALAITSSPTDLPLWGKPHWLLNEVFNATILTDSLRWLWRDLILAGGRQRAAPAVAIESDYIRQGPQRPPPQEMMTPNQIKPEKIKYYDLIGKLCVREGLNCLYLHGPLASPTCERSRSYFHAVADRLAASNIRQVTVMPICLALHELGDSEDHVRPMYKGDFTKAYYDLLKPYLLE